MPLRIAAYENGDHACILWFPADLKPIADCRGFAIRRTTTKADGSSITALLNNYVDFGGYRHEPMPPGEEYKRPFQRYLWWDYAVAPGERVSYQVIPVVGPNKDALKLDEDEASAVTPELVVTGQVTAHIAAYFNKGIIAAQWVSRELAREAQSGETKNKAIRRIIAKKGDPLRQALSGLLRSVILDELAAAFDKGWSVYAALYELNDPELIAALKKLKERCHLILGNGAFKSGETDENAEVRKALRASSKIQLFDRIVGSGHFAHNKFVVFCDEKGVPQKVLTGSTNWTVTGLCTQANNGLLISDPKVAKAFRDQWDQIRKAKNGFPKTLVDQNSRRKSFTVDGASVTAWFVPTSAQQDMKEARKLIAGATDGGLFLFFNPGKFADTEDQATLLQAVTERLQPGKPGYAKGLYFRGVVNQRIAGLTDAEGEPVSGSADEAAETGAHDPGAPESPVLLYGEHRAAPVRAPKAVLVPAAIKTSFSGWEAELLSIGVMVHSKVVVLDPFGDNPVVMTGSHNLGTKASRANDDNLVILQGPGVRPAAIAYAMNCIAIYQEYRWRNYVATHQGHQGAWQGLVDNADWQKGHLVSDRQEMDFWLKGAKAAAKANALKARAFAPAPLPAPAPAPAPAKAARKKAAAAT